MNIKSNCEWPQFYRSEFFILPKIPWEKGYHFDLLHLDPWNIFFHKLVHFLLNLRLANFLNMFFQNYQTYSEERVTILYSANSLKFNCYNHYYFLGLATFLHVIFRYYLWYDEKKIVSWGTRTIFCSNIIFTNNSTCDLPHFCMCSLGSTHDTLGKDMLPGDPRTTLSSMIQIISNSVCDCTHFSNILFDITKDTLRKGILLWYTTMRSAKSL